jgi:ribonuclease P protein component
VERLRRKGDIQRVFREGRRFLLPWAVIHARRRDPEEHIPALTRVTVIAGRRFPTAVVRNRAKRILREACRAALGHVQTPWDVLLVARPEVLGAPYSERVPAIADALRQAGVIPEKAAAPL